MAETKKSLIDRFMDGIPNVGFSKRMREVLGTFNADTIRSMLAEAQGRGPEAKKKMVMGKSPLDKKVTTPRRDKRDMPPKPPNKKSTPSVRVDIKIGTGPTKKKTEGETKKPSKKVTNSSPPLKRPKNIGEPTSIAQAKRMGLSYFFKGKGDKKKKLAAVTKEELDKSGHKTLRAYLNAKGKPAKK